jgi:hypothetical protein
VEWLLENWEMVLSGLFAILVLVLAGKKLAYWRWFNEVAWFAWVQAEKEGIAQGIKGYDKLKVYLETWRKKYVAKWGHSPGESAEQQAVKLAAELSAKEKVIRLSDPT